MCYLAYLEFALFPLFSKRKILLVDGLNVHSYISYKIFRHKDKDTKSFLYGFDDNQAFLSLLLGWQ